MNRVMDNHKFSGLPKLLISNFLVVETNSWARGQALTPQKEVSAKFISSQGLQQGVGQYLFGIEKPGIKSLERNVEFWLIAQEKQALCQN